MSTFKFKTVKSYSKVLRVVKRDLWGNIILTNNNKFKRIYTKLYSRKRKVVNKLFKANYIKNFLIISGGKILNKKFFGAYLSKKARKKRVKKYKQLLNAELTTFDEQLTKLIKLKKKELNLTNTIATFELPALPAQQQRFDNLISKLNKLNITLATKVAEATKLRKSLQILLTKLKGSFYFKRLQNRKKKEKKKKKKSATNLEATKHEYVTEQQKLIFVVEMLKLKKDNFRLYLSLKKKAVISKLKKKKAELIAKLGIANLDKINNIIKSELIKHHELFKVATFVKNRTNPERLLRLKSETNKQIKLVKEKLKTQLPKSSKLLLLSTLLKLQKKRRNENYIRDYIIYKEKYKLTDDYKNKFDLKTLTAKKYDNSYFLKKYKNFFRKFLRNRYVPSFYDLNFKKRKRRQFKSILNLSYIKTYTKQVKTTKFGRALNQQQTLKRYLGNLSTTKLKKLYNFFKERKIGKNKYNFFLNLESTLFCTLLRSKLFTNYIYLEKIIKKGHVLVNGEPITEKFYKLKPFDKITFKSTRVKFLRLKFLSFYVSKFTKPLSTLIVSYSTHSILFLNYPNLAELTYNFKLSFNIFRSLYKKY